MQVYEKNMREKCPLFAGWRGDEYYKTCACNLTPELFRKLKEMHPSIDNGPEWKESVLNAGHPTYVARLVYNMWCCLDNKLVSLPPANNTFFDQE